MGFLDNLRGSNDTFELKKDDEFLTRPEVCQMFHVKEGTIRRWEKSGKIKVYTLTASNMDEAKMRPEDYRGKRYKLSELKELLKPSWKFVQYIK